MRASLDSITQSELYASFVEWSRDAATYLEASCLHRCCCCPGSVRDIQLYRDVRRQPEIGSP